MKGLGCCTWLLALITSKASRKELRSGDVGVSVLRIV